VPVDVGQTSEDVLDACMNGTGQVELDDAHDIRIRLSVQQESANGSHRGTANRAR
jgi:hypothetical protein